MKWLPLQQLGLRKINSSHEWIFHDLRARKNFYCVIIILNSFFFVFQNLHVPCVHLKCQFLFFINRNNLEWLGRATNWAKFTATASLGVIHKVCVTYVGYVCKQKKKNQKRVELWGQELVIRSLQFYCWLVSSMGHFKVPKTVTFKNRLNAKSFSY